MKTFTAAGIVRYDDKLHRCGKLLGLVTFTDGKSLKVWASKPGDPDLHAQCKQLNALPKPSGVRYQFRHSDKWGDALTLIESTLADHELYDLPQRQDIEKNGVGIKGYLADRIAKGARSVNPKTPVSSVDITAANTVKEMQG